MSETGTDSKVSYVTHANDIKFLDQIWKNFFNCDDYKYILKQVRELIGFAKRYKYDDKQHEYKE